jgi:DtxR family Mn-dependent transcriptional regulator
MNEILSESVGDYLKCIYHLKNQKDVTISEISNCLQVAPSSVTKMMKKLVLLGLVNHSSHKNVSLTEKGELASLRIIRRHRLLELFLVEVLAYSWDEVHLEADKLEHHISEKFEDAMFEILNKPEYDPHGDPIPSKDGVMPVNKAVKLNELEPGDKFIINWIDDSKPEFLKFVKGMGLLPKTGLKILEKQAFDGPLTLLFQTGDKKSESTIIGIESCKNIYVSKLD